MKTVIATLAALLLVGCYNSYDQEAPDQEERFEPIEPTEESQWEIASNDFTDHTDENLQIVGDSYLSGTVGPMEDFFEPTTINGEHGDNYTVLEMIVQNDQGAAMLLLEFYGSMTHEDLVPGYNHTFNPWVEEESSTLSISGIGCAGDSQAYRWDYDNPIRSLNVQINEVDQNTNELAIEADVAGEITNGSLLYSHD